MARGVKSSTPISGNVLITVSTSGLQVEVQQYLAKCNCFQISNSTQTAHLSSSTTSSLPDEICSSLLATLLPLFRVQSISKKNPSYVCAGYYYKKKVVSCTNRQTPYSFPAQHLASLINVCINEKKKSRLSYCPLQLSFKIS